MCCRLHQQGIERDRFSKPHYFTRFIALSRPQPLKRPRQDSTLALKGRSRLVYPLAYEGIGRLLYLARRARSA